MNLSDELIHQFVKITNDTSKNKADETVYGTVVEYEGKMYARLDGSDRLTPMDSTTVVKPGDRVMILIKNHQATATGNISSPSARNEDLDATNKQVQNNSKAIGDFATVLADKADIKELEVQNGRIKNLETDNVEIKENLSAANASIENLKTDNIQINNKLSANEASIDRLKADKLDASAADLTYATIEDLNAANGTIHNLEADYGDFKNLAATQADLEALDTKKLNAEDAKLQYANIDFSNIGKAAIEQFYATSGVIKNLVIGDQTITGELVGVTIKGDLIEGNTIVADKLVVKGEDGLYYKLNMDGMTTTAEQTDYNSLKGSILQAKSVTAEKIDVKDLVAFDATIGGFHISNHSIYSGVKDSVGNATSGIYLGDDGQVSFGDSNNFIKYYKDAAGQYHLAISAESLIFSSGGESVKDAIEDVKNDVDSIRDEITTVLRIESSRGNIFKNDNIATILSAVIYHGTSRITDSAALKAAFGDNAHLQWKWQRLQDMSFGIVPNDNGRIENDGFTFTILPEDVETKVTYMCELIT